MTRDVDERKTQVSAWFTERLSAGWLSAERLPAEWLSGPIEVEIDDEEALVLIPLAKSVDPGSFRDTTREPRIQLARQAEDTFGLKISWGTEQDGRRRLFTTLRTAVSVPLAMPERRILDGLVAAGVATDRTEAVAWCIRLVGHHEADWLRDLRDAVAAASTPSRRDRPIAI